MAATRARPPRRRPPLVAPVAAALVVAALVTTIVARAFPSTHATDPTTATTAATTTAAEPAAEPPTTTAAPAAAAPHPTPTARAVRRPSPSPSPVPSPTVGPTLSRDELVADGGFEDGLADWYVESGVETVTGEAHRGAQAARLDATGGYADRRIAAEPGTTYRLSVWGKLSAAGDTGTVGLIYRDDAGNRLSAQEPSPLAFAGTAFARRTLTFAPPADVATVQVYLWKQSGPAAFLVDDLSVRALLATPTPDAAS
jgi:hypothetical protein